ncbi:hypothetical protein BGZ54_005678 [Gamsiella multidivaricata]|nr:hypothetical protein BGZ54_005678 [Gamsiella multidivaricata]
MEKLSIFDVPLLKDEVTQYLSNRDLAHCSCVSKKWSTWFMPTLWRTLDFGSSDFNECTLQKHHDHVKTILRLSIARLAIDDFLLSNLWSLEVFSPRHVSGGYSILMEMSSLRLFLGTTPTVLRTLKLELWLIDLSVRKQLLKVLQRLPQLEELDLTSRRFLYPLFILQLFQACSNLDSLILRVRSCHTILYEDEYLPEALRKQDESTNRDMEQMPETQLRELGLYVPSFGHELAILPLLLAQCPHLQVFRLGDLKIMGDLKTKEILEQIVSVFEDDKCPKLRDLELDGVLGKDTEELNTRFIRSLGRESGDDSLNSNAGDVERQCGLGSITAKGTTALKTFVMALTQHQATTLTFMYIIHCRNTRLTDFVSLVSSLPKLYTLAITVNLQSQNGRTPEEDLALHKGWVCLELKRLALYYTLKRGTEVVSQRCPSEELQSRFMHYVFPQISRLSGLEEWRLGRDVELLCLSDGFLGLLPGLKRLKSLTYIARSKNSMDTAEAEWMIENWPRLIHVADVPARKEFTLYVQLSMSAANSIDALREQLAQMTEQLARLQERNTTDRDPQIKNQRPSTVFYPSEAEARRYPPIKPNDPFFLFKHNISDEELWELFRAYPKNHAVGYEPPKIPNGMHSSSAQKAHDTQLRMIQKRIAHLTRSVDLFLHKIWPLEGKEHLDAEEMVELCSTFAILIRDQLAAVGGRITAMRMDNLRPTQGASFKQDPPTWSTHTKSRTRSNSSRLSRTHSSPARVFNNSNTDPTLRRTIAAPISRIRNGTSTVGTRTIHTGRQQKARSLFRVGNRLARFLGEWRTVTDDPNILATVREGYRVPFEMRPPVSTIHPQPHPLSQEATASMDKENLSDAFVRVPIIHHHDVTFSFSRRAPGVSAYLDDLSVATATEEQSLEATEMVLHKLKNPGFLTKDAKSSLTPLQSQQHLGSEIDTSFMTLKVPGNKVRDVRREASKLANKGACTVR